MNTNEAASIVSPKTCTRCNGKGVVASHVQMGKCFRCNGLGVVESDKATIAARKAYVAARTALGVAAREHSFEAHVGLSLLEENEASRAIQAVDSYASGRTDVLDALAKYFADNA